MECEQVPLIGVAKLDYSTAVQRLVGETLSVGDVVRTEQGATGGRPHAAGDAGFPPSSRGVGPEAGEQQDRLPIDELDLGDLQLAEALARIAQWGAEVPVA